MQIVWGFFINQNRVQMNQVSFDDSEFKKGFASKLKDVEWISHDYGEEANDCHKAEGLLHHYELHKVTVSRHLQGNGRSTNPFTYVFFVEIDGIHAGRWGVDEEEMDAAIDWFQSICSDAWTEEWRREDRATKLWKEL